MSAPNKPPLLDVLFRKLFQLANLAQEYREARPNFFKFVVSIPIWFLLIYLVMRWGIDQIDNPAWWPFPSWIAYSAGAKFLLSFILSLFLVEFLGRGFFPLLFYLPQTIAMRNVGLFFVTEDPRESWRVIQKGLNGHDNKKKIQVICISGRHLFKEERTEMPGVGMLSPLHEAAVKGRLEVIMPRSNPDNLTIKNRYETYHDDYKRNNNLATMGDFIAEIEQGKKFLKLNGNTLYEHDILCMWRVLIFSNLCVVQNYFPNPRGEHSFLAPIMVFRPLPPSAPWISYYETFYEMFRLVKGGSEAV